MTTISCLACSATYQLSHSPNDRSPLYCAFCGSSLSKSGSKDSLSTLGSTTSSGSVTLVHGHVPHDESIQFSIGPYQVISSIGKGGMGEVFLAYDTTCGRRIALKRIREDLAEHKQLHNRFLKEARITSQLTHPAIIPIYSIHGENELAYYTMPFVQGETLRQIIRDARQKQKVGEKSTDVATSIPALIRIFISICQAVAYAHAKGVLHRDLKPENIIVGQYGEVLILDWGLAKMMKQHNPPSEQPSHVEEHPPIPQHETHHPLHQLTHLGKVVGTVSYMAPERALGQPANFQTDIYSLGVILYQLLTLRLPFHRGSLKEFRQHMHTEQLYDPIEVAPYRDVPRLLSRIVLQCLTPAVEQRYQTVNELIRDLDSYIEGRSEWFQVAKIAIENKEDWEFQENVLIAEHVAITRSMDVSDWVSLMISKESFAENIKLEARVRIGVNGHGIGFLLSIPEATERVHLNDGYCLWLGSDLNKTTKLLRSTVEVMNTPDIFLQRDTWYQIRIEKIDTNIYFYLNDVLQFSFISHIPLVGTHIGLLSRDADYTLEDFTVYVGNLNITVNCLAVPDAFLAHKDYTTALSEYRRIGYSFPGRAEGREAMFRAGITLLEQSRTNDNLMKRNQLYDMALEEFEKLHDTSGAPFEYLGKALVYQAQRDYEEEIKCFELAFRRYPKHPLLPVLEEQVVYRMHDSSRYDRKATYNFVLLVVRHMPQVAINNNTKKLFSSLIKHWEPLSFFEQEPLCDTDEGLKTLSFAIQLAFWLAKPYVIEEIIREIIHKEPFSSILLCNALYCLVELGAWDLAGNIIEALKPKELSLRTELIQIAIQSHKESLDKAIETFFAAPHATLEPCQVRTLLYLLDQALLTRQPNVVHKINDRLVGYEISSDALLLVDCAQIRAFLLEKQWDKAGAIFESYPLEMVAKETTPLNYLYGCWLAVTEGKEIASIHFSGIFEVTYPQTWTLLSHYLNGKLAEPPSWFDKAFIWEKRQLYAQLSMFYHCSGDEESAKNYHHLELQCTS